MKLPAYNHDELESKAGEFLATYGKRDGFALNVELVIERFGWRIIPVTGLAEIAEAYVPIIGDRIYIDENQFLHGGFRYRFTLAEELAHILLHRPLFKGLNVPEVAAARDALTDEQYVQIEREAKYLAGALLMPRDLITESFSRHFAVEKKRQSNDLSILKAVIRRLNYEFNVSCHAISIRCLNLALIDQSQLDDYLSYLDSQKSVG